MQGKKTGGRHLGTLNKLTRNCREAIEHAAGALGGAERLAQWAAETPENETSLLDAHLPAAVTARRQRACPAATPAGKSRGSAATASSASARKGADY